jgi:hypothetical protein
VLVLAVEILIFFLFIVFVVTIIWQVEDYYSSRGVKAGKNRKIDKKTLDEIKARATERVTRLINRGKWPGIRRVSQKVPIQTLVRLGFSFKSIESSPRTHCYVPEDKIFSHIRKRSFPELLPLWAVYLHLAQFYETRKLLKAARKVIKEIEFKEKRRSYSGAVSQHTDEKEQEKLQEIERFLKALQR